MTKKATDPLRMVLVEWLDAYTQEAGWKSRKKLMKQEPVIVRTIGWLIKDAPDFVIVAGSHVPVDDDCDGDCTIPRGMIRKLTDLKIIDEGVA